MKEKKFYVPCPGGELGRAQVTEKEYRQMWRYYATLAGRPDERPKTAVGEYVFEYTDEYGFSHTARLEVEA